MAAATLSPSAKQFFWNVVTGAPLANGLVYTVTSGGSYPGNAIATYQDSNASVQNGNPIQLNGAGYATIYLKPGNTYKYLVYDSGALSAGTLQYSQDGIEATPTTTTGLDAVGTAGESFAAGQVGYLSDGSGGKTPGLFYLGDSANTYSSTLPLIVAIATTAITVGGAGVFRQGGVVSGLSGLTAGGKYYIGTSGALTATAPTNSRLVGQADNTTTQLDVAPTPALANAVLVSPTITTSVITPASAGLFYGACGGRLTLTTASAVPSGDVTGATNVFFTPYAASPFCGNIGLYDGSTNWTILPFAELTLALGTLTSGLPYDVFAYNNSGAVALRSPVAWTNGSTRATALALQNGVLVKTGATTDRYLGTFFTDSTTVTSDAGAGSATSGRHLYNYYNRVPRSVSRVDPSGGWNYTTATVRQANGNTANQVQVMQGVAETPISLALNTSWSNTNAGGGVNIMVGIGEDSTTTTVVGDVETTSIANGNMGLHALLSKVPSVGHHVYSWNEWSVAVGTSSCVGASTTGSNQAYGLYGTVWA